MNAFKKNLHIWITTATMAAFLTGWGFLAHAPKLAATQSAGNASTQTVTSNSPLQALQNLLNIHPRRSHRSTSTTSLRTGGS